MQTGEMLQHYEVRQLIGRGGFGEVYRAFDTHLEIDVAIKVLLPIYANNEEMVQRFIQGAQAAASLKHTNIIEMKYLGNIRERQLFFSVMEYLPYGTLADRINAAILSREACIEIFVKVAGAVHSAHEHGIIHRDIKPDNILFQADNEPVVTDFDLSRMIGKARITDKGTALGTAYYISPEQAKGKDVSPQSDVYSLGVMLFYMLTGELPFNDPQISALLTNHLYGEVPQATDRNPDLPTGVNSLIEKAMAKQKERRFPSALDLAHALLDVFPEYDNRHPTSAKGSRPLGGRKTETIDPMVGSTEKMLVGAQLSGLGGSLQGQQFLLRQNIIVIGGSGDESPDLNLDDKYASKRHGRLENQNGDWFYIDLGSRNGTYLVFENGTKKRLAAHEPFKLSFGDMLELGDTLLRFDPAYE